MLDYEIWLGVSGSTMSLAYKSSDPENYPIYNPKYKIEVNSVGELTFTMGANHPLANNSYFRELATTVCVVETFYKNNDISNKQVYCPFAGRVLTIEEDENDNKQVTCEGFLGLLNDYYERKLFLTVPTQYWSSTSDTIYAGNAVEELFYETHWHFTCIGIECAGWGDYKYFDNGNSFTSDYASSNTVNNPEKLTNGFESGSVLYTNVQAAYPDDKECCTAYEALFNEILKKCGGIVLPSYVPIYNSSGAVSELCVLVCYNDYDFSQTGGAYGFIFPYPREVETGYDYSRFDWLPRFDKGYNILRLNKESSFKTKYSGIVPIGKDANGDFYLEYPTNNDGKFLFNSALVSKYCAHIAIPVRFETASSQSQLMSMGQYWLDRHSRDVDVPDKYTITGPEPCELGYGDVPIMLMRDVLIREDTSELLENSPFYPCLSMEIDIQNPQNNTYVIGPYIDDMYSETTISSR